jgi:hypothetical protein
VCNFIYLPEDARDHSRIQKFTGLSYQRDPWVLDDPPDFQVEKGNSGDDLSSKWLSRGYAFINIRDPMHVRTFLDVVCDAIVKEGGQPLRVFPAMHQGIEELRNHHLQHMQQRSNRVYSRMPPVFM